MRGKVINKIKNKFPIILAHGIAPFDIIFRKVFTNNDSMHYFKRIKSTLEKEGNFDVYVSEVNWAGELDLRATQLKDQICSILNLKKYEKAIIIAHSMGGLDSRRMLVMFPEMVSKVKAIATIGSPHLGSEFADFFVKHLDGFINFLNKFNININGIKCLTTKICLEYNKSVEEIENQYLNKQVIFRTIVGKHSKEHVFIPLKYLYEKLKDIVDVADTFEGDGIVSVSSQMWKEEYFYKVKGNEIICNPDGTMNANHINETGRWDLVHLLDKFSKEEYEKAVREVYLNLATDLVLL